MQNLTDLIQFIPNSTEESPEDIFASAPGLIFPDDSRNQHGEPGAVLVYQSARFGDIELRTADPDGEIDRRLFGHYLWNAGILMAERISGQRLVDGDEVRRWSVEGETVLELGAGVGLTGMVASLAGAREVIATDYPTKVILDNLQKNIDQNQRLFSNVKPLIHGHEWGVFDDDFSVKNKNRFSRLLAADCYWMPQVHEELVMSMLHFLCLKDTARIFAISGFHSGRAKLAAFFDTAVECGLVVEEIYEENAEGLRRPWEKERDGGREDHTERKKWLAVAILRRAL
ncbi:Lysine methyltransferase-like protein 3 [Elsinoe fawcettii]|nr:Lysine methyltransferase-like protein 3 [Elsinoe fawcettii]